RLLRGSLEPGAVVLDQQLAATLQTQPGDTITLTVKPGGPPLRLRVSGIAIAPPRDVLSQPLAPLVGPAAAQPPANIVIIPLGTFASRVAPQIRSIVAGAPNAAVPGAPAGVQWQVQAQVDPAAVGGSPSDALRQADQIRNRAERSLPGQVQFVD